MDRLALSKRTRKECGVEGEIATTVNQKGIYGSIVDWVDSAHEDIQNRHRNWDFLRKDFSFETIAGAAEYTPLSVNLSSFSSWLDSTFRCYKDVVSDEQWIFWFLWSSFRDSRLLGSQQTTTGRPIDFSIRPNKSLYFWPIPDDIYTIVGEYFMQPQVMEANTDTPLIPEEYHMAIVWRAVMYFAADQGASNLYHSATREFNRIFYTLENDQLPEGPEAETLV